MTQKEREIQEQIFKTTFGVEIEMTAITRKNAAKICADVLGTGCRVEDTAYINGYRCWSCFDSKGREWKFVSDSSIHNVAPDDGYGCELNTPPLLYNEDMETLQQLVRALRHAGAKSGAQYGCGIHVHVGSSNHTVETVRNFVNLVYSKDELVRKSLGVANSRGETWCKPLQADYIEAIAKCKTMEDMKKIWYEKNEEARNRGYEHPTDHYNSSRYHILNLHRYFSTYGKASNTIEIRAFNASLHAGEIRSYVLLVLSMNAQALCSRNIKARKNPVMQAGNEKFAMRTWLNKMGWFGEMYKTPHELFIKRLSGNTAHRFGKDGNQYR